MMMEVRTAETDPKQKSYKVEGYATTFEPYVLWEDEDGAVYESFTAECFKNCDMSDVIFQFNHEGRVFARQSNGTLQLDVDEHGLHVVADLGSTEASRAMFEDIASGLVTKMSWGFLPKDYSYNRKTRTIEHRSVKKIFDVSAVSIPANNDTQIEARSFVDGEISKAAQELREQEQKRKALELKIKLAGF